MTPNDSSSQVRDALWWVIEMQGPAYLQAFAGDFRWTEDARLALHFATKDQADAAMMAVRTHRQDLFPVCLTRAPRPVEHAWVAL